MSLLSKFFQHSGGMIYHARAVREQGNWHSHVEAVRAFLTAWNPSSDVLVLIGPSGGYSLPKDWLAKFKTVIAVEPDLIARTIFEFRTKVKPLWITEPVDFEDPIEFMGKMPATAAILFCNVLGQIAVVNEKKVEQSIQKIIGGHAWASYHDVISGSGIKIMVPAIQDGKKKLIEELKEWVMLESLSDEDLIRELTLHLAYDFFPAGSGTFRYWEWKLTSHKNHLIEGVFHAE